MSDVHITAVINGHAEDRMAVAALRSFAAAIAHARDHGLSVQPLYVLDTPTAQTAAQFEQASQDMAGGTVHRFDCRDQGLARNAAVGLAQGRYTAFLDADDLWTERWLYQAWSFLEERGGRNIVAHPAYNYFFQGQKTVFRMIDQESDEFSIDGLRVVNYWDALAMAPTELHRRFPYSKRDIRKGWAYEDWAWNCETAAAGVLHKVVPDSVIFKRRRSGSQTIDASTSKARMRKGSLVSYSNPVYQNIEGKFLK